MTAVVVALLLAAATWLVGWGARPGPGGRPGGDPPHAASDSRSRSSSRLPLSPRAVPWRRGLALRSERAEAEALDLLDALAPALRAGLPPVAAVRLIGSSSGSSHAWVAASDVTSAPEPPPGREVLPGFEAAAARGEPLAPQWFAYAQTLGSDDVQLVAAAWSLCDTLGSPLAPTVSTVAEVVRRRRSMRQRIAAALAGPRATMRVLTALPLAGPFVALAVGVSPGALYSEPAGAFSLVVGLTLLGLGRLWAGRMVWAVTVESPHPRRWG